MYQELELFATSDARGDATVVMGESAVSQLSDADWKKLALLLPLSDAETASLPALSRGKRPVGLDLAASEEDLLAEDDVEEEEEDEEEEDEDDNEDEYGPGSAAYAAELKAEEKANAKFCSEWLNVAVRSIVALLLRQVLGLFRRLEELRRRRRLCGRLRFRGLGDRRRLLLRPELPRSAPPPPGPRDPAPRRVRRRAAHHRPRLLFERE